MTKYNNAWGLRPARLITDIVFRLTSWLSAEDVSQTVSSHAGVHMFSPQRAVAGRRLMGPALYPTAPYFMPLRATFREVQLISPSKNAIISNQ